MVPARLGLVYGLGLGLGLGVSRASSPTPTPSSRSRCTPPDEGIRVSVLDQRDWDRKYPPRVKGRPSRLRVWGLGLGLGVWGLRFGVWGLGFGFWGLGLDPSARRGGEAAEVGAEDRGVDCACQRGASIVLSP